MVYVGWRYKENFDVSWVEQLAEKLECTWDAACNEQEENDLYNDRGKCERKLNILRSK